MPMIPCGENNPLFRVHATRLALTAIRILLLWIGWVACSPGTATADPPLSFQDEVQELVKEAASQSTVVPDAVKKGGEKKSPVSVQEGCLKIGAKLSSVGHEECMASGLRLTGSQSVEGFPILLKDFTPPARQGPPTDPSAPQTQPVQARILLIGGVHGDEYSSISIVFKWIKILEKTYSGPFQWHIVPLVNPDGLLQTKSTRTNAHGVDLNRNFPTRDWKEDSADYWVRRTGKDPRRFPGKSPLSEPETSWLFDEIKNFQPNVIVSIHAPFGLLDFDGPPTTPPERLGNIYLSLLGTYPGSLGRYAVESLKIPIITIELPHAGVMPSATETETIWSDLIGWIRGHVFDHAHRTEPAEPASQPAPVEEHPPAAIPAPAVGQSRPATPLPLASQPVPTTSQPLPLANQPAPTQPAPTAGQPAPLPAAGQPLPGAGQPTATAPAKQVGKAKAGKAKAGKPKAGKTKTNKPKAGKPKAGKPKQVNRPQPKPAPPTPEKREETPS
ncbi:MAG: succinylglutamate desuccinylase/aspartoacylase family protein [Magnetococcales bacterium]|nr:succinylglutamate desuccinylase/aspartoacylase family protein [Magnetococcales bacterium]